MKLSFISVQVIFSENYLIRCVQLFCFLTDIITTALHGRHDVDEPCKRLLEVVQILGLVTITVDGSMRFQ